jgi:hypothetical protein
MPATGFFQGTRHRTIPQNGISFHLRAFFSSLLGTTLHAALAHEFPDLPIELRSRDAR